MIQTVVVPIYDTGESTRKYWIKEVSTILDADKDVKFVDVNGNDACINYMHLSTDGGVKFYTLGMGASDVVTLSLAAGGFHDIKGVHYIYADGTDASINLVVRYEV